MRKKLVAGNWKMNGSIDQNEALLNALVAGSATLNGVDVAVCVPFPYLFQTTMLLETSGLAWGAQNLSEHASGAYTGEVSAAMLKEFSCKYVLVGHSERRTLYGEDDVTVARKYAAAQASGLVPILCVGETLAERDANATESVVGRQLDKVIEMTGIVTLANCVVAYEPVWAIGTGKTATAEQAQAVHQFIRGRIAARDAGLAAKLLILYGGSVKASNAAQLLAMPDIDGGLIGGASLVADDFLAICHAGIRAV
ncbi:MAG: triose-phosphate isomerase [Burkholderiales bacterium]